MKKWTSKNTDLNSFQRNIMEIDYEESYEELLEGLKVMSDYKDVQSKTVIPDEEKPSTSGVDKN